MSMQDSLADMLTRIRNAQARLRPSVSMPSSKLRMAVAQLLLDEGYISDFAETGDVKKQVTITLKL